LNSGGFGILSLRKALISRAASQHPAGGRAGGVVILGAAFSCALVLALSSEAAAMGKSPPPSTTPGQPPAQPAPAAPAAPAAPIVGKPASAPSKPIEGAIPAPEIPSEVDQLFAQLRSLEERVGVTPAIVAVEAGLPDMAQRIADAEIETKGVLTTASSLTALTNLTDLWAGIQADLKAWADRLRVRATDVGSVIDELQELADTWSRTREEARRTQAPIELIKRIDTALAAIATLRKNAVARRVDLLTLQVKVGELLAKAQQAHDQVTDAKTADLNTLLVPDRPPIWRTWSDNPPLSEMGALMRDSASPQFAVFARFARDRVKPAILHLVILSVLISFALAARRQVRAWMVAGTTDPALRVHELPISTALIVTLMVSDWFYVRQPMIAVSLIGLALLLPVLRIIRQVTHPAPAASLWAIAVFLILNRFRDLALLNAPALEQEIVFIVALGATGAIVWLWRTGRLSVGTYKVPVQLSWVLVLILATASVCAFFGYMRLARLLGGGVLRSVFLAVALYAGLIVSMGVLGYMLRVPPLSHLHLVTRYRILIERRVSVTLWWIGAVVWLSGTLEWFSLLDDGKLLLRTVLGYKLTRGFVSISLGDVVGLIVTIWVAFLLSRFIRCALEEDVYPRLPMGRGLPYAISSLVHYVILLLGFLAALGAMGMDLNRITLLTGAFGVGVGFGLQTIVNNFVSGIILLVERPIQVGDAIQMGDLDGEVRQIGIRSTRVHTWRGAEVLVPNATLLSGNLTNWTLADRTRRIEIPVGVAYGTDPKHVMDVLTDTAASVSGVLANPAPLTLFQGFGDSTLNFEIRAWTDRFDEHTVIRSQMAVAVNDRLKAEGIEIPLPQRDVNLRYPPREEM